MNNLGSVNDIIGEFETDGIKLCVVKLTDYTAEKNGTICTLPHMTVGTFAFVLQPLAFPQEQLYAP